MLRSVLGVILHHQFLTSVNANEYFMVGWMLTFWYGTKQLTTASSRWSVVVSRYIFLTYYSVFCFINQYSQPAYTCLYQHNLFTMIYNYVWIYALTSNVEQELLILTGHLCLPSTIFHRTNIMHMITSVTRRKDIFTIIY